MKSSKYFIIGAGISGLVLAYELAKKGKQVRIFESLDICRIIEGCNGGHYTEENCIEASFHIAFSKYNCPNKTPT